MGKVFTIGEYGLVEVGKGDELPENVVCARCQGEGLEWDSRETCKRCDGSGFQITYEFCDYCGTSGISQGKKCKRCSGKGYVKIKAKGRR